MAAVNDCACHNKPGHSFGFSFQRHNEAFEGRFSGKMYQWSVNIMWVRIRPVLHLLHITFTNEFVAPALEAVKYNAPSHYNAEFRQTNKWRAPHGTHSNDVDVAWHEIELGAGGIWVTEEEVKQLNMTDSPEMPFHKIPEEHGGGYLAMLEVFHLLHCLVSTHYRRSKCHDCWMRDRIPWEWDYFSITSITSFWMKAYLTKISTLISVSYTICVPMKFKNKLRVNRDWLLPNTQITASICWEWTYNVLLTWRQPCLWIHSATLYVGMLCQTGHPCTLAETLTVYWNGTKMVLDQCVGETLGPTHHGTPILKAPIHRFQRKGRKMAIIIRSGSE